MTDTLLLAYLRYIAGGRAALVAAKLTDSALRISYCLYVDRRPWGSAPQKPISAPRYLTT